MGRRAVIDRDELVAVAARLLADHGVGGMQLVVVARAAGVSVGSIYNHFPSKEHLLAAVRDRVERDFVEAMQAVAPSGVSLRGAVPALTAALVQVAQTSPTARVLAELPTTAREGAGEGDATLIRAWIADRVRAAQATGEVSAGDAEDIADLSFALVKAGLALLDRHSPGASVQTLVTAGLLALIPAQKQKPAPASVAPTPVPRSGPARPG